MGKNFSKYFLPIMCLVFLVYLINTYIEKRESDQTVTSGEKVTGRCTIGDFTIKDLTWHKEDRRAQGIIDSFTVTNRGDYDCRDIRGHMRFLSKDGDELGKTDFNVFEYLHAKETKTFTRIPVKPVPSSEIHEVAVTLDGTVVH